MPNWCQCSLTITGDKKQLAKLKKDAKGRQKEYGKMITSPFVLEKLLPIPKELQKTQSPNTKNPEQMLKKYGAKDWYDWSIKNWGTKWGLCSVAVDYSDDNCWELFFDTAWCPPVEGLKTISAKYPKLFFLLKYDEGGMGFRGVAKIQNGDADDQCLNY